MRSSDDSKGTICIECVYKLVLRTSLLLRCARTAELGSSHATGWSGTIPLPTWTSRRDRDLNALKTTGTLAQWIPCVLTLGLLVAAPVRGAAQVTGPSSTEAPRVGLVLSGGGAKGFAHVGVIEALEEAGLRIDVVAGTSMGSVVGGLYAIGTSTDSIKGLIRRADWSQALSDDIDRELRFLHERRLDERTVVTLPIQDGRVGLPVGVAAGSNILRLAELSTWPFATVHSFDDLPRPFVAVATDIETGEAVVLRKGTLSEAMRASAGLPGALEPFEIDGRLLVDGAVVRNLPAEDAQALGADILVCSDVSDEPAGREELGSLLDVLDQVMSFSIEEKTAEQRRLCDVLIRPELDGLSTLDFERFEDWFIRGEEAVRAHRDAIVEIAGLQSGVTANRWPIGQADSVAIASIAVQGVERERSKAVVLAQLGLQPGDYVDAADLEDRLRNLDTTDLFGLVRYRLDEVPGGVRLTLTVEEGPRNQAGLGLRYDDERRAALLFTATLHNLVRYGSVTRFDLRVGAETQARISYLRRREVTGRLEGGTSLGWSQGELRLAGPRRPRSGIEVSSVSATFGLGLGRTTFLGAEALGEWTVLAEQGYPDVMLGSLSAVLDHESLDRIDVPTRGADVRARWEFGISDLTPGEAFSHFSSSARLYIPLHEWVTADIGFFAGSGRGLDLPRHRGFLVGGAHPSAIFANTTQPLFHGVPTQELAGSTAQIGRAGLRVDLTAGLNVRWGVDVGAVRDDWQFPIEDPLWAWALTLGANTIVGPVRVEWGSANGFEDRFTISVGRRF